MNMPGFTAEISLYKTSGQYQAYRSTFRSGIVEPAVKGTSFDFDRPGPGDRWCLCPCCLCTFDGVTIRCSCC